MSANEEARRKVVNRLRRARGQLDAVINAVESDAGCRDVITQLSAVTHALSRAGFLVVATAMEDCITDPDGAAEREGIDTQELEKIFLSLV